MPMRSRLISDTKELAKTFADWCAKADDIRVVTAWATEDCAACNSLTNARSNISTMVIGLDFYTTSPSFLKSFRSAIRIGTALGSATFHPKLYLFQDGDSCCCIMGSSNFTSGGFGGNTEINVCIEGAKTDAFFQQITTFIDDQEKNSEPITTAEIADYADQFQKLKNKRKRLAKFRASQEAQAKAQRTRQSEQAGDAPPEQLNKSWAEFVGIILAPKRRARIDGGKPGNLDYLQTAEHAQGLFSQHGKLGKMPLADRQFIGGTSDEGGWFGSMKGAGKFGQRLNSNPASLDAALDHIPLSGALKKTQFDAFTAAHQWKRAGVATASRLLAMKRPDLFVCVDSKNRYGIAEAFDVSQSSLYDFPGYWDLMQRIWRCAWWRAPRPPQGVERRIWDARAAILDSIYYKPKP